MNLDKINRWLSLSANIGVLIGIGFLSLEIRQSNRIAERDGRSDLVSEDIEIQRSFLENPTLVELMVKLETPETELTSVERFQVQSYVATLRSRISNINISYESGLLDGEPLQRQVSGVLANIRRVPGILHYFEPGMPPRGDSVVYDMIRDGISRIE